MENVSLIATANRIFSLRDTQIMLDRDLAELYQVTTKALNQAVKRNNARFPSQFKFQLTPSEMTQLVTECDPFSTLKHSSVMPYAFTEQGVAMLSAILKSELAIEISIQIMNAFVAMRKQRNQLHTVISRIESIEVKQAVTENKLNTVLVALEYEKAPKQGVFFEGQLFDAYVFASDLVRQAKISIEMIDNYVDERTFMLLSKRNKGVSHLFFCPGFRGAVAERSRGSIPEASHRTTVHLEKIFRKCIVSFGIQGAAPRVAVIILGRTPPETLAKAEVRSIVVAEATGSP
jgi:hypothetical protein